MKSIFSTVLLSALTLTCVSQEINNHKLPIVQSDLSYVEAVDVQVELIETYKSQLSCYEMWTNTKGDKVLVQASLSPAISEQEEIDGRKFTHKGDVLMAEGNSRQLYYFMDNALYLIEVVSWDPVENAQFKRDYIYFDQGAIIMYDQYTESIDYWNGVESSPKVSVTERAYYFENGTPINMPDTELNTDVLALENVSYISKVKRVEP